MASASPNMAAPLPTPKTIEPSDASFISYIVSVHVNVDGNTTTAM